MAEEQHLKNIGRRAGVFDGRTILGTRFENEQGVRSWYVTTWIENDHQPIADYWVEAEKFYEMLRLDISGYPGVPSQIKTGREIIEMDVKKKGTILKGLAQWELEALEISRREEGQR